MSYATTIKKGKKRKKGRKLTAVKYRLNLYAWLVTFTFPKIKLIAMKYLISFSMYQLKIINC